MALTAMLIDSGLPQSHDTYNGLSAASDGAIYYVLCVESWTEGARMFRYDPRAGSTVCLADLTEACGEAERGAVPQGKSHVPFFEYSGRLYFATHVGIYTDADGRETMPVPPAGTRPYPGGHFLAYDLATGQIDDLALAPAGEGILTMTLDGARGVAYALTWPSGQLLALDLLSRRITSYGPVSLDGEAGAPGRYRTLCRSLALDPRDGAVYYTTTEGWIFRLRDGRLARVTSDDLAKDYFGRYDASQPGHMGYHWRQTAWREPYLYGVHGNSGYLFQFDPDAGRVELIDRLTSLPSRRAGMFDQFSYGYLGFTLGPDGDTLYYLTGAPIYSGGRRVAGKAETARGESKGEENLHLVTYNLRQRRYTDHGAITLDNGERPSYVNSIAVDGDGAIYFLTRVAPGAHTDLARLAPIR